MIKCGMQEELLLKLYGLMIHTLSDTALTILFENESNLLSPILRFIKEEAIKPSVQQEAKRVVEIISIKINNIQWIQNLLY